MESQSNGLFALLLLIALMVWRLWKKRESTSTSTSTPLNLPPGPWKLPIIGNIHQLVGSLPHHKLRDLAMKYGPLMHLQLGEVPTVVASSPEAAKEIMKNHDLYFASRPSFPSVQIITYNMKNVVFAEYGEYWRQLRKICTLELFSAKRVRSFRSIREEVALNLINFVSRSEGASVDLSRLFSSSTCSLTAKVVFGKQCKDQDAFVRELHNMVELTGGFSVSDVFPSAKWLHVLTGTLFKLEIVHRNVDKILQNIIDDHITRRRRKTTAKPSEIEEEAPDLVDVLLGLQETGDLEIPLTNNNIKAVILDMFAAGTETSSTTLEWLMSELMRNPKAMTKVQAEVRQVFDGHKRVSEAENLEQLSYFNCVIKETLRLHPPLPLLIPRECREHRVINGHDIPAKTRVIVNAWAIGRDPNYWTEPEKFHPERFLHTHIDYKGTSFEYLPFGAGRRLCPGASLGLASMQIFLASLLYHFDWELPDGRNIEGLDMEENFGSAVTRKNPLMLVPTLVRPVLL